MGHHILIVAGPFAHIGDFVRSFFGRVLVGDGPDEFFNKKSSVITRGSHCGQNMVGADEGDRGLFTQKDKAVISAVIQIVFPIFGLGLYMLGRPGVAQLYGLFPCDAATTRPDQGITCFGQNRPGRILRCFEKRIPSFSTGSQLYSLPYAES